MKEKLICQWLKLPGGVWPPDYYTLLGLEKGAGNRDDIELAVLERMELLRHYQLKHPEHVTEAMNVLAQAMNCLTDNNSRTGYDRSLGLAPAKSTSETNPSIPSKTVPNQTAPASSSPSLLSSTQPISKSADKIGALDGSPPVANQTAGSIPIRPALPNSIGATVPKTIDLPKGTSRANFKSQVQKVLSTTREVDSNMQIPEQIQLISVIDGSLIAPPEPVDAAILPFAEESNEWSEPEETQSREGRNPSLRRPPRPRPERVRPKDADKFVYLPEYAPRLLPADVITPNKAVIDRTMRRKISGESFRLERIQDLIREVLASLHPERSFQWRGDAINCLYQFLRLNQACPFIDDLVIGRDRPGGLICRVAQQRLSIDRFRSFTIDQIEQLKEDCNSFIDILEDKKNRLREQLMIGRGKIWYKQLFRRIAYEVKTDPLWMMMGLSGIALFISVMKTVSTK